MVQVQGAREDLLIAGHHPLGWEDGEFPRGALLVVLAQLDLPAQSASLVHRVFKAHLDLQAR